jgi:hypothetical protein
LYGSTVLGGTGRESRSCRRVRYSSETLACLSKRYLWENPRSLRRSQAQELVTIISLMMDGRLAGGYGIFDVRSGTHARSLGYISGGWSRRPKSARCPLGPRTLQEKQEQRDLETRHEKTPLYSNFRESHLLGTPVVFVGDPGNSCWAPRYVAGWVSQGRVGRVFCLFARLSGVSGRLANGDPCWGPR